jgi:hypothetical protein
MLNLISSKIGGVGTLKIRTSKGQVVESIFMMISSDFRRSDPFPKIGVNDFVKMKKIFYKQTYPY